MGDECIKKEDAIQSIIAHDLVGGDARGWAEYLLENAPTIDAVPRWIPCEERLPRCNESIIFTEVCMVAERQPFMGIGFYYGKEEWNFTQRESEKQRLKQFGYMSDNLQISGRKWHSEDSNIIAWMPLPEPYVGERKDDD